jgi:hypothetical protein
VPQTTWSGVADEAEGSQSRMRVGAAVSPTSNAHSPQRGSAMPARIEG